MDDEKTTFSDFEPQFSTPDQAANQPVNQNMQNDYSQQPYGQPMNQNMQNGYYQQPYGQPMNQDMQNGYGQQPYSQPMNQTMQNGYGQPMNPNMQNGYGQPMNPNMQNGYGQPSPKKPMDPATKKKLIIGGIIGVVAIAVVVLLFTVIIPILTRSELQGRYEDGDDYYIFDNGCYVYGYGETLSDSDDSGIYSVGTYTYKDGKISLTPIGSTDSDDTYTIKFDDEDNTVSKTYEIEDKKASLELDKEVIQNINETFETAVENVVGSNPEDEWYFIYDDDLADPDYDFEEELAEELDYDNNATLQILFEQCAIAADISIEDGEITIVIY